jgi:hypothetical protein
MPRDGIKQKHESFGMLQFSRLSSNKGQNLFGSSIEHSNTIAMRLCQGEVERGLNTDWYYAGRQYFEVEMSQTQFAEAISSMNQGSGVPVTIKHMMGKRMESCPQVNKRQQFEQEFEQRMVNMARQFEAMSERAESILNGAKAPTKGEKQEILNAFTKVKQELASNIPYVNSCFNEQMDRTVLEAKGEVEALVQNTITRLGMERLEQLTGLQPPDRRADILKEVGSSDMLQIGGDGGVVGD